MKLYKLITDLNDNTKVQLYCRVEVARDFKRILNFHHNYKMIGSNTGMSVQKYIEQLSEFEESRKAKYKTARFPRHGMVIDMLMPAGDWAVSTLNSFVAKYVKYIVQKETGLKYIAWKYNKGNSTKVKVYISDREYYHPLHGDVERYASTCYINKRTNLICSPSDPEAVLKNEKGQIKKDSEGNPILKKFHFKETKTRIFAYKDSQKEAVMKRFVDFFVQSLLKIKCQIVQGKFFRRMNLRNAVTPYHKRIIVANNQLMQYIQNEINIQINKHIRYPDSYEIGKDSYLPGEAIITKKCNLFIETFNKYQKIFNDGYFYRDGNKLEISNCRCDLAENNLSKMKSCFDQEIQKLRKQIEIPGDKK